MNDQELETIKAELRQISELIGPGTAYELLLPESQSAVTLAFRLKDMLSLIPPPHRMLASDVVLSRPHIRKERMIQVAIPQLFQHVERGRVFVSLGFLAEHLPVELMGYVPHLEVDKPVEIPIGWVHEALWLAREDLNIPWSRWLI